MLIIRLRERGITPRKMRRAFSTASKAAWRDTVYEFHQHYRDKRFTAEHAIAAGYARRKGELLARGSKAFRRSYMGQKQRLHKHQRPLEFSGKTRKAVRFGRVTATSKGGRVAYAGARAFNFRHPKSRVRMNQDFSRITSQESRDLAEFFDHSLDEQIKLQDG